jgi:hypothetical protein
MVLANAICHGGSNMKNFCGAVALAATLIGSTFFTPATAAPPTVVPSPGYDARLQEQRAALQRAAAQRGYQPVYRRPHKHRRMPR